MLKVTVKRADNKFQQTLQNLRSLNKESISVGHFEAQGDHPNSQGMSYVELMVLYAFGLGTDNVRRDPLLAFANDNAEQRAPEIKAALMRWASRISGSGEINTTLLDSVGMSVRDQYRALFGVVGPLMPPDSDGTPLKETGALKAAVAFNTSKNSIPRS